MIDRDLHRRFPLLERQATWTDVERARQLREAIAEGHARLVQFANDPVTNAARIRREEVRVAACEEELRHLADSNFLF